MEVELGGLVRAWTTAIKAAEKSKEGFTKTGEICATFFSGSMDAMWNQDFRGRFLGSLPAPKFKLTLNKTFELTSIVGPSLMWSNPGRTVESYRRLEINPDVIPVLQGFQPGTPEATMLAQEFAQEQEMELMISDTRNKLLERYLNYSQREQPGGGLKTESGGAILDALIKGRGVIRVDAYKPYGANYELTGGFRVNVDDLLIDPNCTRGNLSDCKWIAIKHCDPHYEVERRFGWPSGSLKGKGATAVSHMNAAQKKPRPRSANGETIGLNDLVIWYEVFSLCGVGTRFKGAGGQEWHSAFEQYVGDEAYICFTPGVNELLNLRNEKAARLEVDRLKPALDWPIPYYRDGRWPVALLDFWDNPNSAWPIATVSAGLGQLTIMNIILCSITERIYRDSLDKFALSDVLDDQAVKQILSLQHEAIKTNSSVEQDITKMISYIQRPPLNFDVWRILDQLALSFDKAVGLMDLMYGLNPGGKVTRTAADANIKGEAVSVRPEFMGTRVEEWHTEIGNIERIAAGYSVKGEPLTPLLGRGGAQLWDELITTADPNIYMREMRTLIEAGSTRRPNKAKEAQNMQQMSSFLLPVAQWYAGTTGNTDPLNALVKAIGDSIEQPTEDWVFPSIQQQGPSEEEIAAQQEAAMLETEKKKATIEKLNLNNQQAAHKMMSEGVGLPIEELSEVEPFEEQEDQFEPLNF